MYNIASIDIETTGLDHAQDQILEIGIVLANSKEMLMQGDDYFEGLPTFHCYVRHERYSGNPYALALNAEVLSTLSKVKPHEKSYGDIPVLHPDEVCDAIQEFLYLHSLTLNKYNQLTVAGKNFSNFDRLFLSELPFMQTFMPANFSHKVLDPGTLYYDPTTDIDVPSLQECLNRAGIQSTVKHTAVEDAIDVLKVLWKKWSPL